MKVLRRKDLPFLLPSKDLKLETGLHILNFDMIFHLLRYIYTFLSFVEVILIAMIESVVLISKDQKLPFQLSK